MNQSNYCNYYNYYVWRRHYLLSLALIDYLFRNQRRVRRRRMWVRNIFLKRYKQGDYENLVKEMRLGDQSNYFNYFRMSPDQFDTLLSKVESRISKQNVVRESIASEERLALTLRYLASGDSMTSISYAYRVGKTTVSNIISETCQAIWDSLWEEVLAPPTMEKWKEIAEGFNNMWHILNFVGAIDGKHVIFEAPPNSGSEFYNYKGSHSIVLMALCDHRYKFTLVDIGGRGRQSDGGIFRNSEIGRKLLNNELHFPPDSPIEYGEDKIPFYITGDEAFPLNYNLMRPYPGRLLPQQKRVFNYRLSRTRRVIENTFGIWAARWRILRRPINTSLDTTERIIIKATICLHNYLIGSESGQYCLRSFIDQEDDVGNIISGHWRDEDSPNNLLDASRMGSNNCTRNAAVIRDQLASYFMFEGAVPFQWNKI